MIDDFYLSLCL